MADMNNSGGSVRVTSLRRGAGYKNTPHEGEAVYRVDRSNRVLGNPYRLDDVHDRAARAHVIAAFGRDLERDLAANGPMSAEIGRLAERVLAGEKVCLACWCAPAPCHGDLIAAAVCELVERREEAQAAGSTCRTGAEMSDEFPAKIVQGEAHAVDGSARMASARCRERAS